MKSKDKKSVEVICIKCNEDIDTKKDHYVMVSTFNRKKSPDDHSPFHFQCWVDYFNKKAMERAKHNIQIMQKKSLEVANSPLMKGILSQIGGFSQINSMLNMPLEDEGEQKILDKVTDKIQNDRRKRNSGLDGDSQVDSTGGTSTGEASGKAKGSERATAKEKEDTAERADK